MATLESKLQLLNQIVSRPKTANSRSSGAVSVNHNLFAPRPDFKVVNQIANNRVDCRRQFGLNDYRTDASATTAEPPYAGASLKGKFKITRAGIVPNEPAYSMPRDTQQSFLAYYERKGKRTPAPGAHHYELPKDQIGGEFGKGAIRKTFLD